MNKDYFISIYSILDSVRGALSASDYPLVVLPALLLQWAEAKHKEEGFEAYREIFSPGRLAKTYGDADGPEQLIGYLLQIEDVQGSVNGGYLSEASSVLRNVPVKSFSEILRVVSEADLATTESVYYFAETFMTLYSKRYGKAAYIGISTTGVRQIEKIALGDCDEDDTVFDGFAGSGISVLHATAGNGKITLQDTNIRMACITEMLCILKGCDSTINVADSLLNDDAESRFSKVIMEPPFAVKNPELKNRDLRYYSPDPDLMCVKFALYKMLDDGTGVVLSPGGVLFRGGKTGVDRMTLVSNKNIDTVIQLPSGSVLGTNAACAILVLRKNKEDDSVLFIDASKLMTNVDRAKFDMALDQHDEELLREIIENRKEIDGISRVVSIRELSSHDFSLVINQYMSKTVESIEEVDIMPLAEKNTLLMNRLMELDRELDSLRAKYVV